MKKILILTLLSIYTIFGQTLSLDKAVAIALQQNQQIQIAQNQVQIAKNRSHPGQANLLPNVSLNGSNQNTGTETNSGQEIKSSQTAANIQASYTLFNGFRNINQYKQLQSQESLTRLQTRSQIENILVSVINNYYTVAELAENYSAQEKALAISKERLERIKERKKLGQADSLDVLSAVVAFNRDSINLVRTRQSLTEAKSNLNKILNRDVATPFQVETEVAFRKIPHQDTLQTIAFNNNANFLAAQKNLKLARINKDLVQSSYYPSLNLSGSYGYSKDQQELGFSFDNPNKNWTTGVSLSFNLFDGFRRNIQNQNAKLSIESRKLETRDARLELKKLITNYLEKYNNSKNILMLEQQNLQSAQLNFERTRDAYQMGQVTSTRFREAQLNLIQARIGISQAKYDAKINEVQLLKIIGKLLSRAEEQDI